MIQSIWYVRAIFFFILWTHTHNIIQETSDYVCFYCNAGNRWRDTISRWNRRAGNSWVSYNNNINMHALYYIFKVLLCEPLIIITLFIHLTVLLKSLVRWICSLPLAQSDRVPLHKGFAVTLNELVCQESTSYLIILNPFFTA